MYLIEALQILYKNVYPIIYYPRIVPRCIGIAPWHERIYYKDLRTNLLATFVPSFVGLTIPYYLRIKESLLLIIIRSSICEKKVLLDSVTWVRAKPKFTS